MKPIPLHNYDEVEWVFVIKKKKTVSSLKAMRTSKVIAWSYCAISENESHTVILDRLVIVLQLCEFISEQRLFNYKIGPKSKLNSSIWF